MLRPCSALLLWLGLAGPGAAQTSGTTTWTLAIGEFTVFGHTRYTPIQILLPRIVYDTGRAVDSARVVDSVRVTPALAGGLAAGFSNWPTASYCDGPATAAMQSIDPRLLLSHLQLAARCGVRLVIVPPWRLLTTNGRVNGVFSVDSAKRLIDRYAAVLPADTLSKYRTTILGLNLADDYTCAACWGGQAITQAQIAEWAAYTRAKLPGLPLGVRTTADWVARYAALAPLLDYTWAQYHTGKGEPEAYYEKAVTVAQRLGLRVIVGVNVKHCGGVGTSPCGAADLVRLGSLAVTHPASCGFLNWRYDEATWQQAEIREAWGKLLALAKARPARECRREANA